MCRVNVYKTLKEDNPLRTIMDAAEVCVLNTFSASQNPSPEYFENENPVLEKM
jgi:hypothetical protein